MSKFSERLSSATNEDKQVNELYKHELWKQFNKLKDDDWDCQLLTIDIDNPMYFNTDGIFSCSYFESANQYLPFYMLMECKLDKDFNIPEQKAEVLTQVVAYLAQLYYAGFVNNDSQRKKARETFKLNSDILNKLEKMPSTVFVGSKTTCFAVATGELNKYYTRNLDFNSIKSASTFKNTEIGKILYNDLLKDSDLDGKSPVFNTSDKYCIADVAEIIYRYNKGIKDADDLSTKNLYRAFTRFTTRVLTPETVEKLSNRQQIDLFAQFIVNRKAINKETNLDGELKRISVRGITLDVNSKEWDAFSWMYNLKEYSDDEQKKITAITDQLISEDDRRRKGDFYTPSVWVEEAHKLLDRNLEPNWRNNYMVWDCAWGTGNLTRDCTKHNGTYIKDLYCSTLHETDLEIATRYNTKATKFQYDFLNDDVEDFERIKAVLRKPLLYKQGVNLDVVENWLSFDKVIELYQFMVEKNVVTMDECREAYQSAINILHGTKLYKNAPGLIDGMLGDEEHEPKKLLFLINPPYGNSGNGNSDGSDKAGLTDTLIRDVMISEKIGGCSSELFGQFIFRILKFKKLFNNEINIGIFSKSNYITGESFKVLRKEMEKIWGIKEAFMLQANQFADVSGAWGVLFALISNGNNMSSTQISIMKNDNNGVTEICKKTLYNNDSKMDCNKWIQEPLKDTKKTKDAIYISSALNVQKTKAHNAVVVDSIGGFSSDTAVVGLNTQYTSLGSAMFGAAKSKNVNRLNYDRVVSFFTARRLITGTYANWINDKDKYMIPNTDDSRYNQWLVDCIVYSLFNVCSYQSSLRNIEYNGKQWDIQNEFFWMSAKDIADMATGRTSPEDINNDVCDDIENFGDNRFVYKKLQTVTLSPDAQAVLDKATELVKSSFKYRKQFNQEHPEYHINTWDAGWYQIKGMLKQYDPEGLKQFNELYKQLEDRMRPLVYELGFLYK